EDVREAARLDAVVTVADAKWLAQRLRDAPEAKNQIAFADVIIINKTDLVSPEELREVEAGSAPSTRMRRCIGRRNATSSSPTCSSAAPSILTASSTSNPIS